MSSAPHVRSVIRAMSILEQFTSERPALNLTEIALGIGLGKSTTHRLLCTLEGVGMVEFDKKSNHYRLGLRVFCLGNIVSSTMELAKQADPLLWNLAEEIDETFFLLAADGDEALCLRRFDGSHPVRVPHFEAGMRSAFNCGAAQRTLLAHLPQEKWEHIVAHHTQYLTEYSLTSRDQLEKDRREILERGYSLSWEDVTLQACALGAPVRDSSGAVVAALSIGGRTQRLSAERLPTLIRTIIDVSEELSCRLGWTQIALMGGTIDIGVSPPRAGETAPA